MSWLHLHLIRLRLDVRLTVIQLLINGSSFLVIFYFYFGSCGRLSLTASFRAHVNIVSLLTYFTKVITVTVTWYVSGQWALTR